MLELMAHVKENGNEPTGPETDAGPDGLEATDTTARDDRAANPGEALDELEERVLGHRQDQIREDTNSAVAGPGEPDDGGTGSNAEPSA